MTLEAWVDPATVSSAWRDVIEKGNDNYYLRAPPTTRSAPAAAASSAAATAQVFPGSALPVEHWSHLAVTYDGSTVRLYVNGAMVDSVAQTGHHHHLDQRAARSAATPSTASTSTA